MAEDPEWRAKVKKASPVIVQFSAADKEALEAAARRDGATSVIDWARSLILREAKRGTP